MRRDKDNVRTRVVAPVVARANENRSHRGQPPIRVGVTPHTFRRTYITFLIAAGYDLPYVQAQVGHANPALTLSVYAKVMRRADRDQLREEIRALLGTSQTAANRAQSPSTTPARPTPVAAVAGVRAIETAEKGRSLHP